MKNNIFKKATLIVSALFIGGASISCTQDFEEINTNPNDTSTPLTYGLFNSATKQITDATRNDFESGRVALPWVQYSAQTAYSDEDRYQYRLTSGDALYRNLNLAASDFKKIIDMNTDPETMEIASAYGPNENQIAASRVMLSYIYLQLVDSFGDIPYYSYGNDDADFQALNIEKTVTPVFASQEKIYTDIMKELSEASDMILVDEVVFTEGDQLFGSGAKLKKFANSLRLRVATRVKDVIPGATAHISDAIADGVMESNADNVGVTYDDNFLNPSPFYENLITRTDFSISKTFVDFLKGTTGVFGLDPRLFEYAAPIGTTQQQLLAGNAPYSTDVNDYYGMPYGALEDDLPSQIDYANFFGQKVYMKNYTEILMEYSEVEFLLSEANGWSQANYINGVQASLEKWGVPAAAATNYIATLPPANEANVITQKWVALYMQPYEAWAEYRRTGYPDTSILLLPGEVGNFHVPNDDGDLTYTFIPAITGLTDLPKRLFYPVIVQTLNPNYATAAAAIGGDQMDTPLIWDN